MKAYTSVFKALSDMTRLRIIAALSKAQRELCICELVDTLALAQYHVSRHMRELKIAGLVQERKEGRFVFYSVTPPQDRFRAQVLKTLKTVMDRTADEDGKRLLKRLALREDDRRPAGKAAQ